MTAPHDGPKVDAREVERLRRFAYECGELEKARGLFLEYHSEREPDDREIARFAGRPLKTVQAWRAWRGRREGATRT